MKKLCIVCDAPLTSPIYTAMYCTPCRTAVSAITTRVSAHLRAAKLPPATTHTCADCGAPAKEYDHRHYSLPLEVEPVCVRCNQRRGPARDIVDLVRIERNMLDWQDEATSNLPQTVHDHPKQPAKALPEVLMDAERRFVLEALERTHWNATAAAKQLGITFRAIRYRMKCLGIKR